MNTRQKFIFLYGKRTGIKTYKAYRTIVDRYMRKRGEYEDMNVSRRPLSEKDIVLITYGDQFREKGLRSRGHLQTLKKFLDRFLHGEINTVHILPFYPFSSDDGFSVMDYDRVDPALGTWKDIKNLGRDYRLMFDAVINHVSQKSRWVQGYLKGNPSYGNFFHSPDPGTDLSKVVRPRNLPLLNPFDTHSEKKWLWTTFSNDQIDLNYSNPKVLLSVIKVLLNYIARGAKFLRLDAVAFLWKEPGTACIHLPQTHAVVKLFRDLIRETARDVSLITETNVPYKENISYFGNGSDEAHMVYNFSLPPLILHGILKQDSRVLTRWAQTLSPALPPSRGVTPPDKGGGTCFFNFTASHDGVGLRPLAGILPDEEIQGLVSLSKKRGGYVSYKANSDGTQSPYELNCNYLNMLSEPGKKQEADIRRFLLSQAIMLAMPGVPGIYIHSLIGSKNYREGVKKTGRFRTINREKLDLRELSQELDNPDSLRNRVLKEYLKMIRARTGQRCFHPQAPARFLELHPKLFCILKTSPVTGKRLLALHNLSGRPIRLRLPDKYCFPAQDLLNSPSRGGNRLLIESYGILWLKEK